ncbi:sensor histidine kinase [Marinicrinis lubricantis]|uniref:Sensor histidine kinase n=1 Tax=Marinicrinis lubricantis TaxID=2086470 RepID=A0ABW1IJ99_9BACL
MVWKVMGATIVFTMILMAAAFYFLYSRGYIHLTGHWTKWLSDSFLAISAAILIGAAFGYYLNGKSRGRLEVLNESLLYLEKGTLSRSIPSLGEDEIGRIADQIDRIRQKWEEQVTTLQRLSSHNAQLAERARFSAITEERQRLARELHDAVSQQLFAISMTATATSRTLEKDLDKAKRQIALIEEMSSVAQSEMRALLLHLRPVHLEGKGLAQGLRELLNELQAKVPIEIQLQMDDHVFLNKGVEDHLFRIVQEALSNTLRHAKADRLEVRLQQKENIIRLFIHDNGVGFDLDDKKHTSYGIVSMKERVNELGGDMHLITAPGKGTKIDIRIPILETKEETEHVIRAD